MTNSISEAMIEAGVNVLHATRAKDPVAYTVEQIYLAMSRASQPVDTGVVDEELRWKVAHALSVPEHHTTWDILPEREKYLYYMQAGYAIDAIRPITPPLDSEAVEREFERRIDAMGWPEIRKFQEALREGQGVNEDAGGFMLRAIKSLLGIKTDPVLTYRAALTAMKEDDRG